MKRMLSLICLLVVALLLPAAAKIYQDLPTDAHPYVEKKYAGWSGVLRAWVCVEWEAGGSFVRWLNACAADFEKRHEGVYLEFTPVQPEAMRAVGESGIRPPELLFFSPGVLTDPALLKSIDPGDAVRPELAVSGEGRALPVAMGGYIWVYNRTLCPDGFALPEAPVLLPDDRARSFSAALVALMSGAAEAEGGEAEEIPDPGLDLGLPAGPVRLSLSRAGETRSCVTGGGSCAAAGVATSVALFSGICHVRSNTEELPSTTALLWSESSRAGRTRSCVHGGTPMATGTASKLTAILPQTKGATSAASAYPLWNTGAASDPVAYPLQETAAASDPGADSARADGAAPEVADDALERFIAGELSALPVSQRELSRLVRLRDAGRGPDWACAATGVVAYTDQLLLSGVVGQADGDGAEREALAEEFIALLCTGQMQQRLADVGAFSVTGARIHSDFSAYAPLDALLNGRRLIVPNSFSEYSQRSCGRIVRDFCSGRLGREAAIDALERSIALHYLHNQLLYIIGRNTDRQC